MHTLDELAAIGQADAQRDCRQRLAEALRPYPGGDPGRELDEELVEQCSDPPDEPEGWAVHLTLDEHAVPVLECEYPSEEWDERAGAYSRGAKLGASLWAESWFAELDARGAEGAVRGERPETADMPRPVLADWLDDRGDPRGPLLRHAMEMEAFREAA